MVRRLSLCLVTLALSVCFAAPALAAPVTYQYTGQDFTFAFPPYTTSDSVTGTFILSAPLAPNSDQNYAPTSYSFMDGVQSLTDVNSVASAFELKTDGNDQIVGWEIDLARPDGSGQIRSSPAEDEGIHSALDIDGNIGPPSFGASASPGKFTLIGGTIGTAPEPSSLVLLGTGVLATLGMAKRRFSQG